MSTPSDAEKEPRKATRDDLLLLLQSLANYQVDYVIIGGQALNLHGYMRNTDDIDILLPMDEVNGKKVVDALSVLPDNAAKDVDPAWLTEPGTVRVADEIIVDLMTLAANGETYDSLKGNIQKGEIDGCSYHVLDIDGLIRTKQSVRPKDRQDLEILRIMQMRAKESEVTTDQKHILAQNKDILPDSTTKRIRDGLLETHKAITRLEGHITVSKMAPAIAGEPSSLDHRQQRLLDALHDRIGVTSEHIERAKKLIGEMPSPDAQVRELRALHDRLTTVHNHLGDVPDYLSPKLLQDAVALQLSGVDAHLIAGTRARMENEKSGPPAPGVHHSHPLKKGPNP